MEQLRLQPSLLQLSPAAMTCCCCTCCFRRACRTACPVAAPATSVMCVCVGGGGGDLWGGALSTCVKPLGTLLLGVQRHSVVDRTRPALGSQEVPSDVCCTWRSLQCMLLYRPCEGAAPSGAHALHCVGLHNMNMFVRVCCACECVVLRQDNMITCRKPHFS
jgi:hypothetical protein